MRFFLFILRLSYGYDMNNCWYLQTIAPDFDFSNRIPFTDIIFSFSFPNEVWTTMPTPTTAAGGSLAKESPVKGINREHFIAISVL